MKINPIIFSFCIVASISFASCSSDKSKDTDKEVDKATENEKAVTSDFDLQAPDFNDPELKAYYAKYTAYLEKVATAIHNKDEARTMALFTEEGKEFNDVNTMEKKARATPEEEKKFITWLRQAAGVQREIVLSPYYKKWNEEYYKKKSAEFDKKY